MLSGDINNTAGQKTVFSNKENLVMALQVIAIKITTKTLYIFMCFIYIYIYICVCVCVCVLYVKNVHFFFVQSYVYTDVKQ